MIFFETILKFKNTPFLNNYISLILVRSSRMMYVVNETILSLKSFLQQDCIENNLVHKQKRLPIGSLYLCRR